MKVNQRDRDVNAAVHLHLTENRSGTPEQEVIPMQDPLTPQSLFPRDPHCLSAFL